MATMFEKCNLCNLNAIRARAKAGGREVSVDPQNNVYVHPPGVKVEKLGEVEKGGYWMARFTAIPIMCVCHMRGR